MSTETPLTSAELTSDFDQPELVRVLLKGAQVTPLDVDSLAYAKRVFVVNNSLNVAKLATPVSLTSLIPERIQVLAEIFDLIATDTNPRSTHSTLKMFRIVLNWCDSNGHENVFSSANSARQAYQAYTDYLSHRIFVDKEYAPGTGYTRQRALGQHIRMKFQGAINQILLGIFKFEQKTSSDKSIPSEAHIRQHIKVSLDIAQKISKAVQSNSPYPISLDINGHPCNLLPNQSTPYLTDYNQQEIRCFDRKNNRPLTIPEFEKLGFRRCRAERDLTSFSNTLRRSNEDSRNSFRMRLAVLASQAYIQLFTFITGATPSELTKFDYLNGMDVAQSILTKQLKSVKLRAGGKATKYTIGTKYGLTLLREYLELRKWILNDRESPYLFFGLCLKTGSPIQLPESYQNAYFYKVRNHFFPKGTENISPRISRAIKNIALHEIASNIELIAKSLNHTTETNVKSYSLQTIERQRDELSTFWSVARKAAELINDDGTGISIPSGRCEGYLNPQPDGDSPPIKPSCSNQMGCLYCTHYSCHADEEDAFKLSSTLYVIEALQVAAPTVHNATLQKISDRIVEILDAMSTISDVHNKMVVSVRHKVFDLGHLTPFWESRMQRFESVGLAI